MYPAPPVTRMFIDYLDAETQRRRATTVLNTPGMRPSVSVWFLVVETLDGVFQIIDRD
jgi:hypothetical protein